MSARNKGHQGAMKQAQSNELFANVRTESQRANEKRAQSTPIGPLARQVSPSSRVSEEYSASEVRVLLQQLFPTRRLVLSQFTLFGHIGVARPTGLTFRRKRRCFRLADLLPIACVLALKEQGIPLKNIQNLPSLIQQHAQRIFELGSGCRVSGGPDGIHLSLRGEACGSNEPLEDLLSGKLMGSIFWGFDIGALAEQLYACAANHSLATGFVEPARRVA